MRVLGRDDGPYVAASGLLHALNAAKLDCTSDLSASTTHDDDNKLQRNSTCRI